MSNEIRPTTLEGIKRLAKSLGAERGIQHTRALDIAAEKAGFQNFRHARHVLNVPPEPGHSNRGYQLFLTAYWRSVDRAASGRETLSIRLSVPWGALITRARLRSHPVLTSFRVGGPDHLAREGLHQTQSAARRSVCSAARVFQFMEATRLRPSGSRSRAFPGGSVDHAIPGRDHSSIWYDPASKRYLVADEPYEQAALRKAPEREEWARQHGFDIIKPDWPGMYAPDIGSRLYLLAHKLKGAPLHAVREALEQLPPPVIEAAWSGESAPMFPLFVSPGSASGSTAVQDRPKAPRVSGGGRQNTIPYVQTFVGPCLRPKGRMPIETHAEVGQLLKSVLVATYHRKGVYNRLNTIRSELDEWVQREYTPAELPGEQFFELYYHESGLRRVKSLTVMEREHHAESLIRVKRLLERAYPDCAPLRTLLRKTDAALLSLSNWRPQ